MRIIASLRWHLRLIYERRKLAITEWWHSTDPRPLDLDDIADQFVRGTKLDRGIIPGRAGAPDRHPPGTVTIASDVTIQRTPEGWEFVAKPWPPTEVAGLVGRRGGGDVFSRVTGYPKPPSPQDFAPPTEEQDPDDGCFGVSGRPYAYGRCDECGLPDGPQHFCTATHDQQGRRLFHVVATLPNNEKVRIGSYTADDSVAVGLEVNGVDICALDLFYADKECGGHGEGAGEDEPVRVILGSWTDVRKGEDWYRLAYFDPDELRPVEEDDEDE